MDVVSNFAKKVQPKTDQPNNPDQDKSSNADLFSSAKVVADAARSQYSSQEYDKAKAAGAGADLLDAAAEYGKLDDTQGVGKYVDQAEGYLRKYNTDSDSTPAPTADDPVDGPTGTKVSESDDPAPVKTLGVDGGSDAAAAAAECADLKSTATDASAVDVGDSDGVKTAITDSFDTTDESTGDIKAAIPTGDAGKPSAGGVGEYVKKAEGFLSKSAGDGDGEEVKAAGDYLKEAEGALKKPGEAVGDYLKEAEGALDKHSGDGDEKTEAPSETQSGGGGFGNVMKMAGGFLKK